MAFKQSYQNAPIVLSEFSQRLISLLKENSRRSISEMAGILGVSRTTASDHIERLKDAGIIKRFTVEIEEKLVEPGIGIGAFFHLKIKRPVCKNIYKSIQNWPELVGCWSISGSTDMTVHVYCRSNEQLENLRDRLSRHPDVDILKTAVMLRQWKQRSNHEATYKFPKGPDLLDIRLKEIENS